LDVIAGMKVDEGRFPFLFRDYYPPDGSLRMSFELGSEFPADLIGTIRMVAFAGDRCLILRAEEGWWEPGGKPEPGESVFQAIEREMREETGAQVLDFEVFGAFRCTSLADGPPKPGLLWPEWYFVIGYGDVEMVGPAALSESEQGRLLEVGLFPLEEACRRLQPTPGAGPWLVDLYRLAAALREGARLGRG
jgi:ADP-ribose pyrophosphatase YjhB (NUDIX family)